MDTCKYCGEPLSESAKFCPNCGKPNPAARHADQSSTQKEYTEAEFVLEESLEEQTSKENPVNPVYGEPHPAHDNETESPSRPKSETPPKPEPAAPPAMPERKKSSGLSVAAFICSLTLILSGLSAIFAIVDLCKDRERKKKHGLSIAALVISGVVMLLSLIGRSFFLPKLLEETSEAQKPSSQVSQQFPTAAIQPAGKTVQPAPAPTKAPAAPASASASKTAPPASAPTTAPVHESPSQIISMFYGNGTLAGLRSDGTVVATGFKKRSHNMDVTGWRNIVAISSCYLGDFIVGLKGDGTVAITGELLRNEAKQEIQAWTDIVSIKSDSSYVVGLKKNGTVSVAHIRGGYDGQSDYVKQWTDIQDIAIAGGSILGLKNGVWITTLNKPWEFEDAAGFLQCGVADFALYPDGNMVMVREIKTKYAIPAWSGLKKLIINGNNAYALKTDGTVVAVCDEENAFYKERIDTIRTWTDLVDIAGDDSNMIGLKKDGTLVFAGSDFQFDADEWWPSAY